MRALILMLLASRALAGEVTLTCTPPTENEDGTALTNLSGIKFYEANASGGPYAQVADEPACNTSLERSAGTYYYVATAYTPTAESVYSNEVEKVVESIPNPPTNLTADANTVAYAIQQVVTGSSQSLTIYPVGLVNSITECDPYIKVSNAAHPNGLSLIQKADVTFATGASANTVYAQCGTG